LARHPKMNVTDLELQADASCTADILEVMAPALAQGRFVWIMGADSFAELHLWRRWQTIPETIPLCVFDRPSFGLEARACLAARRYAHAQTDTRNAASLPDLRAPAWSFIPWPLRSESSTEIRTGRNRKEI